MMVLARKMCCLHLLYHELTVRLLLLLLFLLLILFRRVWCQKLCLRLELPISFRWKQVAHFERLEMMICCQLAIRRMTPQMVLRSRHWYYDSKVEVEVLREDMDCFSDLLTSLVEDLMIGA